MELSTYKKYFALSYDQFVELNKSHISKIVEDVRYEKINDVTRVDLPDNQFFFFNDGLLKMIYISGETVVNKVWNEFKSTADVSVPEKRVRSRAGKTSNQLIFAAKGFTVSITHNDVNFIELYPPCSLEDYLEKIYIEPGPFIR